MSTNLPNYIDETNLSHAWGKALLYVLQPAKRLGPLVLSIDGFSDCVPHEDPVIRDALDAALTKFDKKKKFSSKESAQTIFPYEHWKRLGKPHRQELFDWYLDDMLPRLKERNKNWHKDGTYFERMINFRGSKVEDGVLVLKSQNQLEHIIYIWNRELHNATHSRHSALQVSCFDPVKDHTGRPRSRFPCLQQISFAYDTDGGLAVNAFYPAQSIFDRAYGNYLGLCQLGHFMAHEMGLQLVRFTCFISHPQLGGGVNKSDIGKLIELVRERVL